MRRILLGTFMVVLAVSMVAYGTAWAGATVKVTREANKPDPVEVKVGEEVAFVNATGGGHAHVSFEGNVRAARAGGGARRGRDLWRTL